MTNQERLQANNAKIEAIQQTLANKLANNTAELESRVIALENKDIEIDNNIATLNSSLDEVVETLNNMGNSAGVQSVTIPVDSNFYTTLSDLLDNHTVIHLEFSASESVAGTYRSVQYDNETKAITSTSGSGSVYNTSQGKLIFKYARKSSDVVLFENSDDYEYEKHLRINSNYIGFKSTYTTFGSSEIRRTVSSKDIYYSGDYNYITINVKYI